MVSSQAQARPWVRKGSRVQEEILAIWPLLRVNRLSPTALYLSTDSLAREVRVAWA